MKKRLHKDLTLLQYTVLQSNLNFALPKCCSSLGALLHDIQHISSSSQYRSITLVGCNAVLAFSFSDSLY